MLPKLPQFYVDDVIKRALEEDINYIDVTTDLLIGLESQGEAWLVMKEDGVISGLYEVALRVFALVDSNIEFRTFCEDGDSMIKGDVIATVSGCTASILKAERTALNLLQHMSGIATYTRKCVDAAADTGAVVCDTRKTLPGIRALQKYAVLCGGGSNHRFNLSSAAMLKDNHIDAYGSIAGAVKALRERAGHTVMVEVEVRDLEQLREAVEVGVDVIMLDNMSVGMMKEAVKIVNGRAVLESSGNVTLDNIKKIAQTGVDVISVGALTHSVRALDISLKWKTCSD